MLTGTELGKAIEQARQLKGVTKAEMARQFGVKPPSVSGWIATGRIDKSKLTELFAYFADVVKPSHWGLKAADGAYFNLYEYLAGQESGYEVRERESNVIAGDSVNEPSAAANSSLARHIAKDAGEIQTVQQNLAAILHYRCADDLERLATLTGERIPRLHSALKAELSHEDMIDLAQGLEIRLTLPEGALTTEEVDSRERRQFIAFLLQEASSMTVQLKWQARALTALDSIAAAVTAARFSIETVQQLEAVASKLPDQPQQFRQAVTFPRTKKDKDKSPNDPTRLWL